jgi:hypothetical protein
VHYEASGNVKDDFMIPLERCYSVAVIARGTLALEVVRFLLWFAGIEADRTNAFLKHAVAALIRPCNSSPWSFSSMSPTVCVEMDM